ncbi:MAG: U32 family peptidase [Clostridia bacterium]|nr:U32 family peptidase [Clostridia bacterium]
MMCPEILSPAGNFEKMKAAILYGADAVYLSGRIFGMRAAADNFSVEELREATAYAHARGVKVYLTVNTMPREGEYEALRLYLEELRDIPIDAYIVADIGVLMLLREIDPERCIHISTQANAVSAADCRAWHALGASRIVLARELTLEEIRAIRQATPPSLELEAFVHGSMCISYSGRCLLSGHFVGRDANRGMCAQPCRWGYTIRGYEIAEEKRPEDALPLEEVNGETFILASRDTCMVEHMKELCEAGINSFKIEGRMKSAYYTAVVTNTYKMARDAYLRGDTTVDPAWRRELESVSHRAYATGYYFSDSHIDANVVRENGYIKEKAYLGVVLSYDKSTGRARVSQRNKVSLGERAELLTPGCVGRPFDVTALFDTDGTPIEAAPHPYMEYEIALPFEASCGDILRVAL